MNTKLLLTRFLRRVATASSLFRKKANQRQRNVSARVLSSHQTAKDASAFAVVFLLLLLRRHPKRTLLLNKTIHSLTSSLHCLAAIFSCFFRTDSFSNMNILLTHFSAFDHTTPKKKNKSLPFPLFDLARRFLQLFLCGCRNQKRDPKNNKIDIDSINRETIKIRTVSA